MINDVVFIDGIYYKLVEQTDKEFKTGACGGCCFNGLDCGFVVNCLTNFKLVYKVDFIYNRKQKIIKIFGE